MRLGFHYHIPAIQMDGQIWTPAYQGRFLESMSKDCEALVCLLHTPRPDELVYMDYALCAKNISLFSLGEHTSVPRRVFDSHLIVKAVKRFSAQIDALLIRGPTPLLPWIAKAVKPVPIALLLVGDQLAGVDDLSQPRWRKEAIRTFWRWNNQQQLRIAQHSLTFINSHLLYRQLQDKVPQLVETRTTTLEESDFYIREDTCQQRPIRLLYTGRIDPSKGIFDMINSLALLVSDGEDIMLDLVGWPEKGTTILQDIQVLSREKGLSDRVIYHGYRRVGPELFAFYRRSDIYIIASQSSEGFPRTIWEAMANSLPVVATRVGSIPDYISGAAELIEPRDTNKLAAVIRKLIDDSTIRKTLIQKGFSLAQSNKLEKRSSELVRTIKSSIEK